MLRLSTAIASTIIMAATGSSIADDDRWMTPTMINARAEFMAPGLNYLTFQNIDSMFATRNVAAGDSTWPLPYQPGDIGDSFQFGDQTLTLDQFMEATSTNGLLVIQDGSVIHETYRNGNDEQSRHISFSMAKSLLATMIGIAIDEGKIGGVDDKVVDYLPDWAGTAYA
jgi:CubicO group peptidase (beta-lactamase class C family)